MAWCMHSVFVTVCTQLICCDTGNFEFPGEKWYVFRLFSKTLNKLYFDIHAFKTKTIVVQVYEISPDFSQVLDTILRDFAG